MQHLAPFWHFKLNRFIPVYSNTFFIGSYQIGTLAFKYKFIIPLYKQYIICTLNSNTEIYIYHQCSSIQQTTYSKENCQKRCFLLFYWVYSYTFMIYKTNVNTEAFLSDLLESVNVPTDTSEKREFTWLFEQAAFCHIHVLIYSFNGLKILNLQLFPDKMQKLLIIKKKTSQLLL